MRFDIIFVLRLSYYEILQLSRQGSRSFQRRRPFRGTPGMAPSWIRYVVVGRSEPILWSSKLLGRCRIFRFDVRPQHSVIQRCIYVIHVRSIIPAISGLPVCERMDDGEENCKPWVSTSALKPLYLKLILSLVLNSSFPFTKVSWIIVAQSIFYLRIMMFHS